MLCYSYGYEFEDDSGQVHEGTYSGFKVEGYCASIDTTPIGYCTLRLMEPGPNDKERPVKIIDLRNIRTMQTDDRGLLKIHRSKIHIAWSNILLNIIRLCTENENCDIDIHLL